MTLRMRIRMRMRMRDQVGVERDEVVNLTHPSIAFVLRTIPPSRKLV